MIERSKALGDDQKNILSSRSRLLVGRSDLIISSKSRDCFASRFSGTRNDKYLLFELPLRKQSIVTVLMVLIITLLSGCGNKKTETAESKIKHQNKNHHSQITYDETGEPEINKSRTPSFTFDNEGRLWSAWAFGKHVYVNYSDDEGKTFSDPVKVNKDECIIATNGENRPKIAADKKGNLFISYSVSLSERFTGLVKFSRSADRGKTFSEPVTINDDTALAGHSFESIGISEDGTIYLFWLDGRLSRAAKKLGKEYKGSSIFYTYSEDKGKTFKPNKKIADHVCECCRIALDFDGNYPVIVYRDIIGDNIRDHSLIRFSGKENFTETKRVTFENWKIEGCPHHGPSLHISNNGIYHLGWFSVENIAGNVFYAKSYDKGLTFINRKRIGSENAAHPFIAGIGENLLITWLDHNDGKNSIKQIFSDDNGKNWKNEKEIFSFKENGDHPFILKDKNKMFLTGKSGDKIYLSYLSDK